MIGWIAEPTGNVLWASFFAGRRGAAPYIRPVGKCGELGDTQCFFVPCPYGFGFSVFADRLEMIPSVVAGTARRPFPTVNKITT